MSLSLFAAAAVLASAAPAATSVAAPTADYRERLPEDEIIYFLLPDRFDNADPRNDRGGLKGGRLTTGFDPTSKAFYNGGDLKGVMRRLDYLQRLGATAVWLAPVFKNKPVQGPLGSESSGYHGYWVTDFTAIDPHFGTDADFRALVDAAHARGMKVYMDIIANHSADVIKFTECEVAKSCPYRSVADFPYQRRGGPQGAAINPGFAGEGVRTSDNFARLTDPNYAYTVTVPKAERTIKRPAWLNDPIYYHNRGDTVFRGESSRIGDFVGLDDFMTEHPRVVSGMIDIFGSWIDRFKVDGFRIDTAKHVNPEFWQAFVPAMLDRAKANGIPNFHIFGEVADDDFQPGRLARHTVEDRLPAVLDFGFKQAALRSLAAAQPTEIWRDLFAQDVLYAGGAATARQLPTFLSNHDQGRFAFYVRQGHPQADDAEVLGRVALAHVLMLTARGVPTIYAGDEQGFAGDGGDQDSRETLFASKVASYTDNRLVGTARTNAQENFGSDHALFGLIAKLSGIRVATPALRRGMTVLRAAEDTPGLLAFSRMEPGGAEVLVAVNTSTAAITRNVVVDTASTRFRSLAGACPSVVQAPGSLRVTLPPLGHLICHADR